MKQVDAELEAMIGYRLKQVQSALRARMDDALRPLGLTTPQYSCLETLSRQPGASNSEIARRVFVTRQTMNTLLRGLQQRGLVERAAQAEAGRALPTALTTAGERLLAEAVEVVDEISTAMTAGLTPTQLEALAGSLTSCFEALTTGAEAQEALAGADAARRPGAEGRIHDS